MKKIILSSILVVSGFAGDTFDLSKPILGKVSFETKGIMKMYNPDNRDQSTKITIDIKSSTNGVKKEGSEYISNSIAYITMKIPNQEILTKTKTSVKMDDKYRILSLKETTEVQGTKIEINCSPKEKGPATENLKLDIGFTQTDADLYCSDDSRRTAKVTLTKGMGETANLVIERDIIMRQDKVKEKTIMNVSKEGKINFIKSDITSKIFSINYKESNINQE